MARPGSAPRPPRPVEPDLPDVLQDLDALTARTDLQAVRLTGLTGDVDAAHARIVEARIVTASVDRLDLTGAALVDVEVGEMRAVEVVAREGSWRDTVVSGGRIGSIDGLRAEWDGVVLRGLRIDYLSLASARVNDLHVVDCEIGTLDAPDARLTRVRFERTRVDEVDTRELRAVDVDLRGLDALSFTDPRGLRDATLDAHQVAQHAEALAAALGIRVR
ncbi:hypothetical protein N3K63_07500 [Microbacterium sp. W1N]|uniref:hypothetical protein n=1 Tax=Microbacterium festucae TaxID=2977531 RepID=UPI0021C08A84|nr:hypothetical protein [Microbacterium festucae]MCT9820129.1 hypothetical protein [Microbacterium festucae]